jgi:hypothetical protein
MLISMVKPSYSHLCGSTRIQTPEADDQVTESSFKILQFWGVSSD